MASWQPRHIHDHESQKAALPTRASRVLSYLKLLISYLRIFDTTSGRS
jgi:hypothetical protein